MTSTEPFFYDSAYKLVKKEYAVANRYQWVMHHSKEWCTSDEITRYSAKKPPMNSKWDCSSECKIHSDSNVCMIIDLDIVFAGGASLKMNKEIGTLLPKKS